MAVLETILVLAVLGFGLKLLLQTAADICSTSG